jgi:hypothetical protein
MVAKPDKHRDHRPIECRFRGKIHVSHYYVEDGKVTVWCQFGSDSAVAYGDNTAERALTMLLELLKRAHYAGRI